MLCVPGQVADASVQQRPTPGVGHQCFDAPCLKRAYTEEQNCY